MRIVFMGTPEFAVESLKSLVEAKHEIVGVVTIPDKPAGRGQKLSQSAVKTYAIEHNFKVLQPVKLKDPEFVEQLRSLNAELQVVVAFRMLPEIIWDMPKHGSINLHASLLPQYRGAAPINWPIINGDTETGITTFKLKHEIDTGDIYMQRRIDIEPADNAGTIHDKLMMLGGKMVVETVEIIESGKAIAKDQDVLSQNIDLRPAPKIFKEDGHICWQKPANDIHNLVRGLSPYPAAWTELPDGKGNYLSAKIFKTSVSESKLEIGKIDTDGKNFLRIGTADNALNIEELQLSGKKRMETKQFLQGFHFMPDSIAK